MATLYRYPGPMASNQASHSSPARRWIGRALWAFLALSVAGAATLAVSWSVLSRDADSFLTLFALRVPKTITKVLDHDGNVIGIFAEEHRVVIPYGDIPKAFVNALVATEDSDFWSHSGVSARGIMRSGVNFITSFGRRREGASTLTMQLIRTVTAKRQKRLDRKLKEIILARKLEKAYSKKQIMEMYANEVYFGGGRYGIEAAAEFYFGKSAPQLNVEECALLAGLVQNPNWYNPYNPDPKARAAAKARRNHVLLRMVKEDYLKAQEASLLMDKPIRLARENAHEEAVAPYVVEEVRKYLYEKYGREQVLNGGLEVTTTVDSYWQEAANEAVRNGLKAVDRRRGFRKDAVQFVTDPDTTQLNGWKRYFEPGDSVRGVILGWKGGKAQVRIGKALLEVPESA
ncbi:MAG TPA: transglycosylase domain-containing protein, partial [Geothrix sp.]|nr:transglycosylase domain-containing protein [Geothrix sp.]